MKIKLSKRKIYLVLYFKTFSLIERITVSFSWKNVTLIGAENLRKFDRFSFIPKNVQNLIHHTKIIILILKTDSSSKFWLQLNPNKGGFNLLLIWSRAQRCRVGGIQWDGEAWFTRLSKHENYLLYLFSVVVKHWKHFSGNY